MVVLKNWAVRRLGNNDTPPDLWKNYLCGFMYGHPTLGDGYPTFVSKIEEIVDEGEYKVVKTAKSEYTIYEAFVSPEYASENPDAYEKLVLTEGELI